MWYPHRKSKECSISDMKEKLNETTFRVPKGQKGYY